MRETTSRKRFAASVVSTGSLLDQGGMPGSLKSLFAALLLALPAAAQTPPARASAPESGAAEPSPPMPQGSAGAQQQRDQQNASAAAAAGAGAVLASTQLEAKEDPFAFPAPTP